MEKTTGETLAEVNSHKYQIELERLSRRIDALQKSVDLLYQDRQILEGLVGSVQSLKEIIIQNQLHQDNARNSIHAGLQDTANTLQDVKESLDDKTVVVKGTNKNFFDRFKLILAKEVK